jgi:hypothetical protein
MSVVFPLWRGPVMVMTGYLPFISLILVASCRSIIFLKVNLSYIWCKFIFKNQIRATIVVFLRLWLLIGRVWRNPKFLLKQF